MSLREKNLRKEETILGLNRPQEKGILVQCDWKDHSLSQYDS